ncbi:DUF4296 domain-containing protein [Mucilaginibacter myungsuensis]|uniref:DUF4296 domain-containing protein n=1 Tax=Mucilaginibacter myungsuensis TaxID=649104 RepID=A0A929L289_9SPHI|nr:DUF4296 domain-containing protein [Mucilaginibacter myungsuensis]MBE9662760.1 DUF4296 domain-containing protein [Mucilaginibacter myungsuensis]MDN3598180.1 DUF4296 domain-containing protein [Mucilaginibacter myungsuensis]
MRIQYKLFFLAMLVLASCTEGEKVPADLIDEERMTVLLANVHVIDGDLVTTPQQGDSLFRYGMGYYVEMFRKHNTDTAKFRKSFEWYIKHPIQLNKMYDNVIKILEKKTDSLNKIPSSSADPARDTAKLNNAVPVK